MSPFDRLASALADRYRLERELGQGGMATVYLAEDLRHDRKVAVKVLRPELAAVIGAERFLSEIKTTANLQHPHILPLFDSGTADGFLFYVMPYIQGETLRDRLTREKQLPIDDAVRLATEVAAALDYAHRQNVVHRDIKPENILLHDGSALVADFGIALAASKAGGTRMTETGMSLGTPHYMSPEQAMGEREITARSDVYALGCVLYEMLVGEPPFTGPTAQSIVAKVMTDDPRPPTQLRKTVPRHVERVTLTALAKLPADRFGTAAAFAEALRQPSFEDPGAARPEKSTPSSTWRRILAAAALVTLGAAAALLVVRSGRPSEAHGSVEKQQGTYSGRATRPAISPDGRFLAYLEVRCPEPPAPGGCTHLEVQELGTARAVEILSGAERLSSPRWTHDGLALVIGGALGGGRSGLFMIPRLGGIPRRLADEPAAYDTHALADSVALVVGGDTGSVLRVIALASGEMVGPAVPAPIRPLDMAWSPDGQRLALSSSNDIHLMRRADGAELSVRRHTLTRLNIRWSADGSSVLAFHWTAGQDDDLVAFPVSSAGVMGPGRLVASQVPTLISGWFDVARGTGRVVVGSGSEFYDIWSFDLAGSTVRSRRLTQGTSWYGPPALTADGKALYFLRADPLGNSLYRIEAGQETALTGERQVVNNSLRLSLDERTITYESRFDSTVVLVAYDLASGTSRRVPRREWELGWLLPGDQGVLWIETDAASLHTTDLRGEHPHPIPVGLAGERPGTSSWWQSSAQFGEWFLSPSGDAVAVLGTSRDTTTLARIPLDGSGVTLLARYPRSQGSVGLAGWSADGAMHVARANQANGTTSLIAVDAATGQTRTEFLLPVPCDPNGVSYAPAGHRAACVVRERRADVMLLDGLRP